MKLYASDLWKIAVNPKPNTPYELYAKPEDLKEYTSWGGEKKRTYKDTGEIFSGDVVKREDLPEEIYHVTTNLPAVNESGRLKSMMGDQVGLGKGTSPSCLPPQRRPLSELSHVPSVYPATPFTQDLTMHDVWYDHAAGVIVLRKTHRLPTPERARR